MASSLMGQSGLVLRAYAGFRLVLGESGSCGGGGGQFEAGLLGVLVLRRLRSDIPQNPVPPKPLKPLKSKSGSPVQFSKVNFLQPLGRGFRILLGLGFGGFKGLGFGV